MVHYDASKNLDFEIGSMGQQVRNLLGRALSKGSTKRRTEMGGLEVSIGVGEDGEEL